MLATKIKKTFSYLFSVSPMLIMFMIIATIFIYSVGYINSKSQTEFVVKEKERIVTGNSSKYLVWTNEETLEVTDSYLLLRFDSSDVYGKLEVGERYCGVVAGWRHHFFSWYRNIITIHSCRK